MRITAYEKNKFTGFLIFENVREILKFIIIKSLCGFEKENAAAKLIVKNAQNSVLSHKNCFAIPVGTLCYEHFLIH